MRSSILNFFHARLGLYWGYKPFSEPPHPLMFVHPEAWHHIYLISLGVLLGHGSGSWVEFTVLGVKDAGLVNVTARQGCSGRRWRPRRAWLVPFDSSRWPTENAEREENHKKTEKSTSIYLSREITPLVVLLSKPELIYFLWRLKFILIKRHTRPKPTRVCWTFEGNCTKNEE